MKRRAILAGVAVSVAVPGYIFRDEIRETVESHDLGRVGVRSVEWENGQLIIDFDPEYNEYSHWILHHEYEDAPDEMIYAEEYPRLGGEVSVDFWEQTGDIDYPTPTFAFTPADGVVLMSTIHVEETGPTVEFELPKESIEGPEESEDNGTTIEF